MDKVYALLAFQTCRMKWLKFLVNVTLGNADVLRASLPGSCLNEKSSGLRNGINIFKTPPKI